MYSATVNFAAGLRSPLFESERQSTVTDAPSTAGSDSNSRLAGQGGAPGSPYRGNPHELASNEESIRTCCCRAYWNGTGTACNQASWNGSAEIYINMQEICRKCILYEICSIEGIELT